MSGYGTFADILVGVSGSIVGGYMFRILGFSTFGILSTIIMAVIGAVFLLVVLRILPRAADTSPSYDDWS